MSAPLRGRRLLLVEDNRALRRGIARALAERFQVVDEEGDSDRAVERLGDPGFEPYDVVVTDLRLPGAGGLAVLSAARERDERTAILLMTAYGTVEDAVEAMRLGAFDFVQKPFELPELEARIDRALGHARLLGEVAILREERAQMQARSRIVGSSPALHAAISLAERAAPTRATVLVTGETGTGKELIAGLIHAASDRAPGPFVKVNCAALPETLLESELFGHERGAFTSADRQRIGRFEQADGGTLFLDEVADMSLATQAKLLRVLQDQQFQRLGGSRLLHTDVRIVAATNRDLQSAIATGDFREDLYFRLHVIGIELPPLRERPGDLEALSQHFLEEFALEMGKPLRGLSEEALERVRAHAWPGNIRELRNVLERAVLLADGPQVGSAEVGLADATGAPQAWRPGLPPAGLPLAEIERAVLMEALERSAFVQKDAASLLGVSRRKLNYMIQRMGITHPSWRINRSVH
ncbi:MAG: hypothetical protein CL910_13750 [Deltaproteobacteria bacterium]|nr:hypothetical protein [Deltaproteobacteria bacterium]